MEQKRGEGKKTLKREDKLGQGVGALKRGAGTPLRTMDLLSISTDWFPYEKKLGLK